MTLKQKVLVYTGLIIAVIIGGVIAIQIQRAKGQNFSLLLGKVAGLRSDMLKTRYHEKKFESSLSEFDLKEVKKHFSNCSEYLKIINKMVTDSDLNLNRSKNFEEEILDEVYKSIDEKNRKETINSDERNKIVYKSNDLVGAIEENFKNYNEACKNYFEAVILVGLDEISGLKGELRSAIHKIEGAMKQLNRDDIMVTILMLRRNEKDFLARLNEKYIKSFNDNIDKLNGQLSNLENDKENLLLLSKTYQEKFLNLTKQLKVIGFDDLSGISHQINLYGELTEPYIDQLFDTIKEHVELTSITENRISYGIYALIIISVIMALLNLAGSIRKQLNADPNDFVKVAQVISSGNLKEEFHEYENVKSGPLRDFINMSKELKEIVLGLKTMANKLTNESNVIVTNLNELKQTTNNVDGRLSDISVKTKDTSQNINSVSAATEEMCATISEISKNMMMVQESAVKSDEACKDAKSVIQKMFEFSKEANGISQFIGRIAEQTNLLALNATIEAARAGEAGKGFSVVANEVKELANQTSQSVAKVDSTLKGIQESADSAITAIQKISDNFGQVTDMSNTVSSALEEQNVTTSEISKQGSMVSSDMSEISNMVIDIEQLSKDGSLKTISLSDVSNKLKEISDQIVGQLGHFKV